MKRILKAVLILMILPILFIGCASDKKKEEGNKIIITASLSPLKEFAKAIGGDKVEVNTLVPENVDAHHIDIGMKDLENLMKSDIFIYNGLGMEEWLPTVSSQIDEDKVMMVDTSKGANIRKVDDVEDPHLWLSLKEGQKQCENIKNALVEVDPNNKEYYENNFKEYTKELNNLYEEYESKFNTLEKKDFVTTHGAFGYLCRDFNLKENSLTFLFGEGESTAKRKVEIVNYCKENNLKVVFTDSSESEKEAETIAKEIGGKVEFIYSLETKAEGKTYIEAMRENLEKIYTSLQ